MKLLTEITLRKIKDEEFIQAMSILEKELGKERVRDSEFLYRKFKEFKKFFIGIFLDNELIGIICGFPREDYLLISEIAVKSEFQRRGFGKMLVEKFEENAKGKYKQINAGAQDNVIDFYQFLGYIPFILIQYKPKDYSLEDFKDFKNKHVKEDKECIRLEIHDFPLHLELLNELKKKYSEATFQYIFSKKL